MSEETERVLTADEVELLSIRDDYADELDITYDGAECDLLLEALNEAYVLGELRGAKRGLEILKSSKAEEGPRIPVFLLALFFVLQGAFALRDGSVVGALIWLAFACLLPAWKIADLEDA